MSERHPIWELLDRIQMDNRDTAAKIVELRAHVASLDLSKTETHGQWQPALGVKDPVAAIRRQIANGALREMTDLDAELAALPAGIASTEDYIQLENEMSARLGRSVPERATKTENA